MSLIEKLDMTGKTLTFKYNFKDSIKSTPSGIMSLIFYIFGCYYWIHEFYYYVKEPHNLNFQIQTVTRPQIEFKDYRNFLLMSCKVNSANNSIAYMPEVEEIIEENVIVNLVHRYPYYMRTFAEVPLKKCSYDMFPTNLVNKRIFTEYYSMCMCSGPNELRNFNVSFFFSDTYYNYMEYTMAFKKSIFNDTEKLKEAYDILAKDPPRSEFFFMDTSANVRNLQEPFKHFLNSHLNYLNPDFVQFSDLYFKKIIVTVDDNFFYAQPLINTGMSKDQSTNYMQQKTFSNRNSTPPHNALLKIRVRTSNKVDSIERISIKIDVFIGSRISFLLAFYAVFYKAMGVINSYEADRKVVRNFFHRSREIEKMKEKVQEIYHKKNEVYNLDTSNFIVDVDLDFKPVQEFNKISGMKTVSQDNSKIKKRIYSQESKLTNNSNRDLNKFDVDNEDVIEEENEDNHEKVVKKETLNEQAGKINISAVEPTPTSTRVKKTDRSSKDFGVKKIHGKDLIKPRKPSDPEYNPFKRKSSNASEGSPKRVPKETRFSTEIIELKDPSPQTETAVGQQTSRALNANSKVDNIDNSSSNAVEGVNKKISVKFNLFTFCCKKIPKDEVKNFENANAFVNYYLDIQIYLKKMMEIEVLKFCFLSKNEREALAFIINPSDSIENSQKIMQNLNYEYRQNLKNEIYLDENYESRRIMITENLVADARERKVSKRMLRIIDNDSRKYK